MRATDEWWKGVDDWRRLQPDMPNRAEAIRRLVAIGFGRSADTAACAGQGEAKGMSCTEPRDEARDSLTTSTELDAAWKSDLIASTSHSLEAD
jgi:hypothetical protein